MPDDDGYGGAQDDIAGFANVTQEPQRHHRERYRLNEKHLETLKFLGPMCAGLPVGDEKLKAMLKYAKSLDSARVRFLPKTPATAWRRLAKVSNNIFNLCRST
jgi:elongation factor P--beta-lysine ligase